MQRLVPIATENNPNGHTESEIRAALTGQDGARRWSFRYELLDYSGATMIESLDGVLSCTIDQNWLADRSKRTAQASEAR